MSDKSQWFDRGCRSCLKAIPDHPRQKLDNQETPMTTTKPEGLFRRPRSEYWWMRYYTFDGAKGKRFKDALDR